ncbi:MAG: PAS domain S-box protein [Rhodospirillales bacterium]|nr:PAS domain S-box protein [Rhodospirillales bacterium]MSP80103.1 PAS domain S-box protein [Rhodospirillales bacterium]
MAANAKGVGLQALLERSSVPDLGDLIARATDTRAIAAGLVTLQGTQGVVVLEVSVVPAPGGKPEAIVLARDLTMDRNLRSALVESRQRYKDLVEISSDFSWEVDESGRFIFVSPRGALGYRADELVGRAAADFVTNPEDYSPLPFLSQRELDSIEIWMRRNDGLPACVLLAVRPISDASGAWRGARGICRDLTEEREQESVLSRAPARAASRLHRRQRSRRDRPRQHADRGGNKAFVVAALTVRSSLEREVVEKAFQDRSAKGITAVTWKAGFSAKLAEQIQSKLAAISPRDVLRPRNDGAYPLGADDLEWQLGFLKDLVKEK